jgi:hypothetical protein
MVYKFQEFEPKDEHWITVEEVEMFLEDAEIIVSDYGFAWTKDEIVKIQDGHRGACIWFKSKEMTWFYNIEGKYIK